MKLEGRTIVVAGGRGHIGSAICDGIARAGGVPFAPRSELTDLNAVEQELNRIPRIGGVVNCAGRGTRGAYPVAPDDFIKGMSGVVLPYYNVIRAVLPRLKEGAAIVNVVSLWAFVAPDPRTYLDLGNEPSVAGVAAAGALRAMTRYYASLLAERRISVNALVPGWFPKKRGAERPDYIAEICSRTPMGRIGQPAELVEAALMLLTTRYMTGQEVIIDGGYACR